MGKFVVKINGEPKFTVDEFVERVQVLSPKGEMGALNCGDDPLLNEIDIVLSVPDGLNKRLGAQRVESDRDGSEPTRANLRSVGETDSEVTEEEDPNSKPQLPEL